MGKYFLEYLSLVLIPLIISRMKFKRKVIYVDKKPIIKIDEISFNDNKLK